jgi:excisionase family DNA binding protein
MADSEMLVAEVAKRLKCSKDKVVQLIQSGRLAALDIGSETRHSYRITEEQYAAFRSKPAPLPPPLPVLSDDNELVSTSFLGRHRK